MRLRPGEAMYAGPRPRGGFTLIEIMMVAAIIAIVTSLAIPSLVRSLRGNRLRTATRDVVMLGRYARSMALLDQRERELVFDVDGGAMVVRYADGGSNEMSRTLDRVHFAAVEVGADREPGSKPSHVVRYRTNGRCDPYVVTLEDEAQVSSVVEVDRLSEATTRAGAR